MLCHRPLTLFLSVLEILIKTLRKSVRGLGLNILAVCLISAEIGRNMVLDHCPGLRDVASSRHPGLQ